MKLQWKHLLKSLKISNFKRKVHREFLGLWFPKRKLLNLSRATCAFVSDTMRTCSIIDKDTKIIRFLHSPTRKSWQFTCLSEVNNTTRDSRKVVSSRKSTCRISLDTMKYVYHKSNLPTTWFLIICKHRACIGSVSPLGIRSPFFLPSERQEYFARTKPSRSYCSPLKEWIFCTPSRTFSHLHTPSHTLTHLHTPS